MAQNQLSISLVSAKRQRMKLFMLNAEKLLNAIYYLQQ